MKFKGTKCIEITKSEYDDIRFIDTISTCQANAIDNVIDYLNRNKPFQDMPRHMVKEFAYNIYMAVINNYRYMKIVD